MNNYITYEDISNAYWSCLKNKKGKDSAIRYSIDYEMSNLTLLDDLNNGTYEIGTSNCFCVTRPKIREVFAANFRDRIVHHLLMNKLLKFFENNFNPHSYSCRVGKGVIYGVRDIQKQIEEIGWNKCHFVKLDISGFFMSIDKNKLRDINERLIRENWDENVDGVNIEWWISLMDKIVMNRPELNCNKTGDVTLFNKLPEHKSLFKSNGFGLPIGNLTSQIFANWYMHEIDDFISKQVQGYGRYVDDIIMLDTDVNKMKKLIPKIRERLKSLNLFLNEKKTMIQTAYKGVPFTGYIIKQHGIYTGINLKKQSLFASRMKNVPTHKMFCRMNSYFGFLKHCLSFWLRSKMWENFRENYCNFIINDKKTKLIEIGSNKYKERIKRENQKKKQFGYSELEDLEEELMIELVTKKAIEDAMKQKMQSN